MQVRAVYGMNDKVLFSEDGMVDSPVSLYTASKKLDELMAHADSNLYIIPTTRLRFFTVYGPWVRPDMAPFLFTKAIVNDELRYSTMEIYCAILLILTIL